MNLKLYVKILIKRDKKQRGKLWQDQLNSEQMGGER